MPEANLCFNELLLQHPVQSPSAEKYYPYRFARGVLTKHRRLKQTSIFSQIWSLEVQDPGEIRLLSSEVSRSAFRRLPSRCVLAFSPQHHLWPSWSLLMRTPVIPDQGPHWHPHFNFITSVKAYLQTQSHLRCCRLGLQHRHLGEHNSAHNSSLHLVLFNWGFSWSFPSLLSTGVPGVF